FREGRRSGTDRSQCPARVEVARPPGIGSSEAEQRFATKGLLQERTTAMNTSSSWGRVGQLACLALLGAVTLIALPSAGRTDQMPEYTGYTRPGVPSGRAEKKGPNNQVIFVSLEGDEKAQPILGGTVYFTVIDRYGPEYETRWKETVEQMMDVFVPGKDLQGNTSSPIDRNARYLYLYQVVNDMPGAREGVKTTGVNLIDASVLTSWGSFPGL